MKAGASECSFSSFPRRREPRPAVVKIPAFAGMTVRLTTRPKEAVSSFWRLLVFFVDFCLRGVGRVIRMRQVVPGQGSPQSLEEEVGEYQVEHKGDGIQVARAQAQPGPDRRGLTCSPVDMPATWPPLPCCASGHRRPGPPPAPLPPARK